MKKILIVDDQSINFLLLEQMLLRKIRPQHQIEIIWAKNGQEALDRKDLYNDLEVVFMDIDMPVMDGHKARYQLKKIIPNVPIIAYTSSVLFEEDKKPFLDAGFDQCIMKPATATEIKTTLQKVLPGLLEEAAEQEPKSNPQKTKLSWKKPKLKHLSEKENAHLYYQP